jgi:hypothetical protein
MIVLVWITLAVDAQTQPDNDPLVLGEARQITLSGEGPTLLVYTATAGEVVTMTARSLDKQAEDDPNDYRRDTVIDVLNPEGRRIAYNNDHQTEDPDLLEHDSVISKLVLREEGDYVIRVNTYGGVFDSDVEVLIKRDDLFDLDVQDEEDGALILTGSLPRWSVFRYTIPAVAGETLTITARDTSRTLDPILRLFDSDDELIAMNDDHGSQDLTLDVLDSRLLDVEIPADGDYTIQLTDFLGGEGKFEIRVER